MTKLIDFRQDSPQLRVMENAQNLALDIGSAADFFGDRLDLIELGQSQGEDWARGVYDWRPLTINGDFVGELRDGAAGMIVYVESSSGTDVIKPLSADII